jgi:hypothetical protein
MTWLISRPVQFSFPFGSHEQKSMAEEEHPYSCFSPCSNRYQSSQPVVSAASQREGMDGILAPILEVTSDLGLRRAVLSMLRSLSRLSPASVWFLLVMGFLS